ncbi:MAG: methyltransferase domain-containing protein [Prolixibacteraceae bacterium]|jgi:SAM-dependent methyltransferase|nr:methyltransferase domain-containing protein [Prolixibacteraceae bacterium]
MVINPEFDPLGQSISNYYYNKDNTSVKVFSNVVEDEELPPEYFFRQYSDMPKLERIALKKCSGKILDVGAGAGCHSLHLQQNKFDVTALETSTFCCEIMKKQKIKKVVNTDVLSYKLEKYDTILLMMNGIGIAETLAGLTILLTHLKRLLNKSGKIILDSSDLIYLFEQEDGSFLLDVNASHYYGEIDYHLTYKNIHGKPFSWLFADHVILSEIAEQAGFKTTIIEYGPHYDYLAQLTIK